MKKISAMIMVTLMIMLTMVACASETTNVTTFNSEKVESRIQKEIQEENLDLQEGEIGLYWGNDIFWQFECFDEYANSLSNPVNLDVSKLEYIVMPIKGKDSRLRVQCIEDKRSGNWSFYYINTQKLDENRLAVYPSDGYSWASNVAKTYRFDMSTDKETPVYYYITFSAKSKANTKS